MRRSGRSAIRVACVLVPTLAVGDVATTDVTDAQRELFAGDYRGTFKNGLEATLTITPEMAFVYAQSLGKSRRVRQLRRTGTLEATGEGSARAGMVRLAWRKSGNTIDVKSPYGSGIVFDGVGGHDLESGARFAMRRVGGQRAAEGGRTITVTLAPSRSQLPECNADVSVSYTQMHDRVRVRTHIRHEGCPVSSGDYTVRLRTIADDGETETRSFDESWRRNDDQPLEITSYYDMNPDHRLVWAQVKTSRKTNCRCLDATTNHDTATTPAPRQEQP